MTAVAQIGTLIIGVQELNGEKYYNVLNLKEGDYEPIAELINSFSEAVVEACKHLNLIKFI